MRFFRRSLFLAGLLCCQFPAARAWDPTKPLIYRMWLAFEHQGWVNMYSTATVLSKSDNSEAFRVVAYSTVTPTYQLLVTTQGYVGISTGIPQAKFHVSGGNSQFGDGSAITISSAGYMTFANLTSTPAAAAGRVYYDSSSNKLRLSTGSASTAWADVATGQLSSDGSTSSFSGALSVGTNTSSAVLTVYSGSGADALNVSVMTSSGAVWTQVATAGWTARTGPASATFNSKMWLLGGAYSGTNKNDVWYTSDGASWTQATSAAAWPGRRNFSALVFDGKIWLFGGESSSYLNDVWYSSDGVSWTQATSAAGWSARATYGALVFDGKMWIIGGSDGSVKNDVWYSADGASWTRAISAAGWTARAGFASVVFNNKMWLLGGNDNTYTRCDVWYSADGATWTQATSSAGWKKYMLQGLVFNGRMWVFGGNSGGTYQNDVWCSLDGATWTQATAAAGWTPRMYFAAAVLNDKMWVFGGYYSGAYLNDVWYSSSSLTSALTVSASGNVGIQNSSPGYLLTMEPSGGGYYSASAHTWNNGSSIRWKENVRPITDPLDKVLKLRGVYFKWKKDRGGRESVGFVAEEVGKILPEAVDWSKDEPGYADGMDYGKISAVLVEAVKEMNGRISEIQEKNKAQQDEIKELRAEVNTLKSRAQSPTVK